MKHSFFLLLCLLSLSVFAQDKPAMAEAKGVTEGMSFVEKPFEELLAQAKKENKVIFIDAYTTWCGPCKMMAKKVFPLPEVGAVYNERYINAKIDMEKGEGPALAQRYGVMAYPTYLFVDGNGDIVHKGIGYIPGQKFLELADVASGEENLGAMNKRYDGGERSADFLLSYYGVLSDVFEEGKAAKVSGEYLEMLDDWSSTETLEMLIASPGPLGGKRMTYLLNHADEAIATGGSEFVGNVEKAIINQYMEDNEAEELPTIDQISNYYKEKAGGMTTRLAAHYPLFLAQQHRDKDAYLAGVLSYYSKFESDNPYELNSIAWMVFEASEDQADLKTALGWAKKSVGIEASYPNMDTLAWLYHKTGDKKMAKETAMKAIEMAKADGQDYSETEKILEKE